MIILKRDPEIDTMRRAGKIVAHTLRAMSEAIVPGKTTPLELDAIARRIFDEAGAKPTFLGYRGFPAAVCISVNEVVVHGIPNDVPLMDGDIVGLDTACCLDGYNADSAWTYPVGTIPESTRRLLNVSRESLFQGLAKCKPKNRVGDISAAVEKYLEQNGYGVVRDLVGHGIGKDLHEEPSIPNYGKAGRGPELKEGMTFCVEPMVNEGTWKVKELEDKWTIVTGDGRLSAHFEHTVAITRDGYEILTQE